VAVVARWQLHPLHLSLVQRYLGIEDLTLPLEAPSYGATQQQVAELARREAPQMEALGLLVDDEPAPGLEDALQLLAKPYLWVDSLWFPQFGADPAWRTVAVRTDEDRVVLGVQPPLDDRFGGMLTVEVHEKVALPQVLLPTLPPAPPGKQHPVRVPESSFRVGQEEPESDSFLEDSGRANRGGSGDREVEAYQAVRGGTEKVRVGQLAANLRDTNGKIHRNGPVTWFDNVEPDGRYLDHDEEGPSGERILMVTPADAGLLGRTIDQLVKSVR
jgi:hypothetical protein